MHHRSRSGGDSRYQYRFGVTAFLLISGTLVLVLYVLPERYVLSSGFRESGMSFPTPTTPFVPLPVVLMTARALPQPPAVIAPGPAEVFWDALTPLLDDASYDEALPLFRDYLRDFPTDQDARREYAITLLAAGGTEDAVPELRRLLDVEEDLERRLLLARTLRELGRTNEAATEYATLVEASPEDIGLWLEWAQAHAWVEEYEQAAEVLADALARHPDSTALRVELARVEFSRDRLEAAAAALAGLGDEELAAVDAVDLRNAIEAALAVPDPVEPTPPTLAERAATARVEGDLEAAVGLFEEALTDSPDDIEIWQAYADLLEYELGDLEGARDALLEVERLGPASADLQYRLAQLEIWMGLQDEASPRLLALVELLAEDAERAALRADAQAMLGDLDRWNGDRPAAAEQYRLALADDDGNERALAGMAELEAEVDRTLVDVEAPRVAATSYAATDTDDYRRVDVGGEWVDVEGDWVWGGEIGSRWLDGRALGGGVSDSRQGVYLDLEAARWSRWATLRSALQFGVQHVRGEWDYSVGGSLRHRGLAGTRTDLGYEHGPAYLATATLQSTLLGVVQDHVSLSHERPLGERWSATATADAAWLRTELDALANATNERTTRLQSALSLGRTVSPTLTLGLAARTTSYTSPGPVLTDGMGTAIQRLFWDPRLAVSTGPFARVGRRLSSEWAVTGSLAPGIAFLDERTSSGWDVVPHVSAEAGLRREGPRFWTALDVFFYQGQFDGYRTFGARLTFSARDWSSLGDAR